EEGGGVAVQLGEDRRAEAGSVARPEGEVVDRTPVDANLRVRGVANVAIVVEAAGDIELEPAEARHRIVRSEERHIDLGVGRIHAAIVCAERNRRPRIAAGEPEMCRMLLSLVAEGEADLATGKGEHGSIEARLVAGELVVGRRQEYLVRNPRDYRGIGPVQAEWIKCCRRV